jgi:lysophospholipase L1-like esterase
MVRRCPLAAAVVWLALAAPASASPQHYYLALGDSHAFGFQFSKYAPGVPASAFHTGYADRIASELTALRLVNYGCPGESTVSFIVGPCPYRALGQQLHDDYTGSQLKASLAFLLTHPGRTDMVTLTLWGNDINAFVDSCAGDFACVQSGAPQAISKFATRLTVILAALKSAAGPHAVLVVTGVYDPNPPPLAQQTHPLFLALDQAIQQTAAHVGARFAPLFATFDAPGALCALTLVCSDGDAHPSDAGYQAIAASVLAATD